MARLARMMIPELIKKKPTKKILYQGLQTMIKVPERIAAAVPDGVSQRKNKAAKATKLLNSTLKASR